MAAEMPTIMDNNIAKEAILIPGADWNEVYKIIEEVFSDYHVTLYRFNG